MTRTAIKICGLTSVADAVACSAAGANWIGLNFHPPSPRCVDPSTAAAIVRALPTEIQAVGLFVNRPAREVASLADLVIRLENRVWTINMRWPRTI